MTVDNDATYILQVGNIESEITPHMEMEPQECHMMSWVNCLNLDWEIVRLSLGSQEDHNLSDKNKRKKGMNKCSRKLAKKPRKKGKRKSKYQTTIGT